MRELQLDYTDDEELGKKMVWEKIARDCISEEQIQVILDKVASELAELNILGEDSSKNSQQKFADGSFKDINIRFVNVETQKNSISESSKQFALAFRFFSSERCTPKVTRIHSQ